MKTGKQIEKVLPSAKDIKIGDVGKLSTLIYKRGKDSILAVGPYESIGTFFNKIDDQNILAVTQLQKIGNDKK